MGCSQRISRSEACARGAFSSQIDFLPINLAPEDLQHGSEIIGLPHVPTTHLVSYSGCEARHALHDRKLPISTAGCRRSRQITRPLRPRSADRTRSLAAVSQKREFFKYLPETIGYFAPRMANIGAQKLVANSQKPAIGGPFSERRGHFLRAPDWLAGEAVLIGPVSNRIPC